MVNELFAIVSTGLAAAWAIHTVYANAELHIWNDCIERWVLVLCMVAYFLAWVRLPVFIAWPRSAIVRKVTSGSSDWVLRNACSDADHTVPCGCLVAT